MPDASKPPVDRRLFLKNQEEYCEKNNAPHFMPTSGSCYHCRRDIIPELIKRGQDGTSLVTGCPLCSYSYCE